MSAAIILKNGRILDPVNQKDHVGDLYLKEGQVVVPGSFSELEAKIYDVNGCWITPGLIDMHVHLREPGEEYKETIKSGTEAAAVGGFTAVACMPNTNPVNDNGSVTKFISDASVECVARVHPVGAISAGLAGKTLAEYGEMKMAGAVAVTDDGLPVTDSQLMRRALEYASSHNLPVISHSEEPTLSRDGCMNEGLMSTRLGLKGIPAVAESIMVQRDIALAELTGARLHLAHISTALAVAAIRAAKDKGVNVTAETAPHYFTLTDKAVLGYDTNAKMNPPLRSEGDRQAIREALSDGTIDAIATDHAPHSILDKEVEFNFASNGIAGLETSLPLSLALVRDNLLSPLKLVQRMSSSPANILGLDGGSLGVGCVADVSVIDPQAEYIFNASDSRSLGKNSPFDGWQMQGKAVMTIVGGVVKYGD